MFEDNIDEYHSDGEFEIDDDFWNEDDSEFKTEIKEEVTEEIIHVELDIPQEILITSDEEESEDDEKEIEEKTDEVASTSSRKRKEEGESSNSNAKRRKEEEEPENSFNLENSYFSFLSTLSTPVLRNWISGELHDAIPEATNKSIDEAIVLAGFKSQDDCDRRKVTLCQGTGRNAEEVDQSLTRCAEALDTRTVKYQMGNVSFVGVPELLKKRIWKNLADSKNRDKIEFRSRKHKRILLILSLIHI